jgi:hypothetical protein
MPQMIDTDWFKIRGTEFAMIPKAGSGQAVFVGLEMTAHCFSDSDGVLWTFIFPLPEGGGAGRVMIHFREGNSVRVVMDAAKMFPKSRGEFKFKLLLEEDEANSMIGQLLATK